VAQVSPAQQDFTQEHVMTMPISVTSSAQSVSTTSNASTQSTGASAGTDGVTTVANAQSQLNAAIVQASFDTAISSKNDPLALLLKTALTGINEALKPTLGDNAVQNAMGQDNTPEGTAGRIVSISTGFFAAYKSQHPGQSDSEALSSFMSTIRGGFEKGFKEATELLKGLGVLTGDVASNIDKTYALVQKGYAAFESSQTAAPAADASASAANSSTSAT
jgi:hypothetical protein